MGFTTQQLKLSMLLVMLCLNGALTSRGNGHLSYYRRRGYPYIPSKYPGPEYRYENVDRTLVVPDDQGPEVSGEPDLPPEIIEETIHPFPKEIPPSLVHKEKVNKDSPPINPLKRLPSHQKPKTLQEIENDGGVSDSSPPEVMEKVKDGEEVKTLHQKTARFHRTQPFHRNRGPHFRRQPHELIDERRPHSRPPLYRPLHDNRDWYADNGKPPRRYDFEFPDVDDRNRARHPEDKRPKNRRPDNIRPDDRRLGGRLPANGRPEDRRPENRRPGDRRPEERRPEDRRPGDRRPEERRPEERRPEDRRPEDRRPENRRPESRRPEERRPEERRPEDRRPEDYDRVSRPYEPSNIRQQKQPQVEEKEPFQIQFEPTRGGIKEKITFYGNEDQSKSEEAIKNSPEDLDTAASFIPELTIKNPQNLHKVIQRTKVKEEKNHENRHNLRPGRPDSKTEIPNRNTPQKRLSNRKKGQRKPSRRRPTIDAANPFLDDQFHFESEKLQPNRAHRPNTRRNKPVDKLINDKRRGQPIKNRNRPSRPKNRPDAVHGGRRPQQPNTSNQISQSKTPNRRRPVLPQQRPNIRPKHQEENSQNQKFNRNKTIAPPLVLQRPQITEYRPLPPQNIKRPVIRRPEKPTKVIQRRPITHYKPHKPRPVAFPKPRPLTNNEQTRPKVEYGFVPFFGYNEEKLEPELFEISEETKPKDKPVQRPLRPTRPTKKASIKPTSAKPGGISGFRWPTRKSQLKRPTRRPTVVEKLPNLPSLHSPYSILKPSEPPNSKPYSNITVSIVVKDIEKPNAPTSQDRNPQIDSNEKVVSESQQSSVRKPVQFVQRKKQIPKKPTRPIRPTRPNSSNTSTDQKIHQSANNQWTALTSSVFNKISFSAPLDHQLPTPGSKKPDGKEKYVPRPFRFPHQNRGPTGIRLPNKQKKPFSRKPVTDKDNGKVLKSTTLKPTAEPKVQIVSTPRPTKKPIEQTKPSFTGFLSGMFDWHGEQTTKSPPTTEGKPKKTVKPIKVTRRPTTRKPTKKPVKITTSEPTTITTTTSTKKPFVYIPKQIYPPTKAPQEEQGHVVSSTSTVSEHSDDFDTQSSTFLQNFFGLFTNHNENSETEPEFEDVKEPQESEFEETEENPSSGEDDTKYEDRPPTPEETIDKDKDRWLGGFKMSHYGDSSVPTPQSNSGDDESIGVDLSAQNPKLPQGMLRYCGSKTDLEFCSVNKLYPRDEVYTVMKRCKVHVDKMVADEIAKLAEHGPVYEYPAETAISDKQKDDDERPWPWTQYVYSKDGTCQSSKRLTDPGYAKDMTGAWRIIIQTDSHTQRVSTETCKETSKPCSNMKGEFKKSRCVQKHSYQMLMSVDPNNQHICPEMRLFRFPTACVCQVQVM